MKITYDKGVFIESNNMRILLDPVGIPSKKPDIVLLSHAHSDHARGIWQRQLSNIPKVMSPATRKILEKRKGKSLRNTIEIREGCELDYKDLRIYAASSGHCTGSLQFKLTVKDTDIAYSGDICLEERIILNKAEQLNCDVLILEATYGKPEYVFPKRSNLYRNILKWCKNSIEIFNKVFICCRTLGTAQELTTLLSLSILADPIFTHPAITKINEVHEEFHHRLGRFISYHNTNDIEGVMLVPLNNVFKRNNFNTGVTTGWVIKSKRPGRFPLSSHADFQQLLTYAKNSNAEKIYTVYGFSNSLAREIKERLGIDAQSIK